MSYQNNPIIATWLTAAKTDKAGALSVPTVCHKENNASTYYGETAYHVYYQKTTKVIGQAPKVEWVYKCSLKQDAWDKALETLNARPEAKAEFF